MSMPPVLLHEFQPDPPAPLHHPPGVDVGVVATSLGGQADARTAELDDGCAIPPDLYRSAAAGGLFRQLVVADLGGLARTPLEWFRTGVELAWHEASFGWVVTQGAAELGVIGAGADDAWARELLSDPLATSAASTAGVGTLSIDGSTSRFGGSWAFNTGSTNASWIGGLAVVDGAATDDGRPVIRWGWVPADRARVVHDWDPAGLRGTGSHSTVIDEQEIPTAWTFAPEVVTSNDRGPHRCLVGNGYWPIATAVAATQLGNARRALDETARILATKAPAPGFVLLARNAAVQRLLVEAEGLWAAARASVERELEALWAQASAHGEVSPAQRAALHRANVAANVLSVRIVDLCSEMTGTAAVARAGVLSRCHRDAHALRGHAATNGATVERNAEILLGLIPAHFLV
jgi:indole-3-acetate monooxygenase